MYVCIMTLSFGEAGKLLAQLQTRGGGGGGGGGGPILKLISEFAGGFGLNGTHEYTCL